MRTEDGLGQRDVEVVHQVVPVAREARMRSHSHVHVQVAVAAAANAGGAATGEAQGGTGVDTRGDVDGVRLVEHASPLAATVGTRPLDELSQPTATTARPRRHHLPEDRLSDAANLSGAAAVRTRHRCRAGRSTAGLARLAGDCRADGDVFLATEDRRLELDVRDDLEIGATRRTRLPAEPPAPEPAAASTEERVEDVAEAAAEPEWVAAGTGCGTFGPERVVTPPPLGVGQRLVRDGDLLELCLGRRVVRVRVGMQLASTLAIGALDLVLAGVTMDTEKLVVIRRHQTIVQPSVRWWLRRLLTTATAASACG